MKFRFEHFTIDTRYFFLKWLRKVGASANGEIYNFM